MSFFHQIMRTLFSCFALFFWLCPAQASFAEEEIGEVVILFDQSASMIDFDPELVSKKWLMEFAGFFKKPYNVVLAGFDDSLHEHVRLIIAQKEDVEDLAGKIKAIRISGLTTDFETPLRYLLELDEAKPLFMALIVSDGELEIWDEKRPLLSKLVRKDQRYEDLNARYRSLEAQGSDPQQIYDLLYTDYHARNLKLIEERLAVIKERFGKKLVFLDVSGESDYFKQWAKAAGSEYIAIFPHKDASSPVERLRQALKFSEQKVADIVEGPQPGGKKLVLEMPVGPEFETVQENEAITKAVEGLEPDAPSSKAPETKPETVVVEEGPAPIEPQFNGLENYEDRGQWQPPFFLLLLVAALIIYITINRQKQKESVELSERPLKDKEEAKQKEVEEKKEFPVKPEKMK